MRMEGGMGHTRKPVNMSLDADLVLAARQYTKNLSETVEVLLTDYVATRRAEEADRQRDIDEAIAIATQFYEEFGLVGAEFLPE
jgi:antitoxin CcdA